MKARQVLFLLVAATTAAVILLDSCRKTPAPFHPATPLTFTVPPGFPQPYYNFNANPVSEEGFLLGRRLFYDGRLSADGYYPCASCHEQRAAFTTFEHDRSHGYNHSHTLRNAPGLANLAWYPGLYNQDGSAANLESIYYNHITNPHEMGETIPNVLTKLRADSAYPRMFRAAFGDEEITQERMFNALTQFVTNLVSANSKYDQMLQGKYTFDALEQNGYNLFQAKCATCHSGILFTDFSFRNSGLPLDPSLQDFGRMRVTNQHSDSIKFRVPSLRNAVLTSYYAHDGRFSYLYMVIQHYLPGNIATGPTVDPLVANGIQLTQTEQDNLVYFLRTLTDSSYINNPRYRE